MKIENQVCPLSDAAKLAALGINQKSVFYWAVNSYNQDIKELTTAPDSRDIVYSAFTVAELSVMLGAYAETYLTEENKWSCGNFGNQFDTQAEASSDALISLIEEEKLFIDAINYTLQNS